MDNKKLISKCAKRDNKAREELYLKYSAQMYSVCLRYADNKSLADDILQQGFLKVFEDIGQVRNPDALPGWIKKVFVNVALQHLKSERNYLIVSIEGMEESFDAFDNSALALLELEQITELIQALPGRCKEVFNLYVIDGYKHKEIAELLKITDGSSKSYLHEAKQKLKQAIVKLNKTHLMKVI